MSRSTEGLFGSWSATETDDWATHTGASARRRRFGPLLAAGLIAWTLAAGGQATAASILPSVGARPAPDGPELLLTKVNLLVADLDRSLAIYRDILGFQTDHGRDIPATSYSYAIFGLPADARMRFVALTPDPSQPAVLSLTEVRGAAIPGRSPQIAATAIVLRTPHVEAMIARLAKLPGVVVLPGRSLKEPNEAAGYEQAFIDPDGHRVLLFRLGPAS